MTARISFEVLRHQRGTGIAGAGDDAGDCHGRNRSIGGFVDGTVRGGVRQALAGCASGPWIAASGAVALGGRLRGIECDADHATADSAADRDAGNVFAVSRNGRGNHAAGSIISRIFRRGFFFSGRDISGMDAGAASDFDCGGVGFWLLLHRIARLGARCRRSGIRRKGRDTRGSGRAAGGAGVYSVGTGGGRGGGHLCRPRRAGEGGCGHGIRIVRDHGGGAGRHIIFGGRAASSGRCWDCLRSRFCRMG